MAPDCDREARRKKTSFELNLESLVKKKKNILASQYTKIVNSRFSQK